MASGNTINIEETDWEILELHANNKQLKEENGRLANIFNHSNDAIFLVNPEKDKILDANKKASELLGFTREEIISSRMSDIHREENNVLAEFMDEVIREGYGWTDQLSCITQDGNTVDVEVSASSTLINDQVHVVAIARDISERLKRHKEINAMATFAELNPAPVMRLDRQAVVMSANPAATNYFQDTEILGTQWVNLCPEIKLDNITEIFETGNSHQHECDLMGKSLVFRYELVPGGEQIHVYGFDITQQKMAEEALRESETKLKGLLKSAPDAVVITDEIGNIIMTNDQTSVMFGYDQDELLQQPVEILMPDSIRMKHEDHRKKYYHQTKARQMGYGENVFGKHKDGYEFPIESSMSPLETSDGVLVMNIIRDISERKEAEEKLITLNESLEQRVTERTEALQQSLGKMQSTLDSTIYAMARIVETKDPYTAGHQKRVSQLAEAIAIQMELPDDQVLGICMAGLIHDMGKIYVPSEILNKPGKLSQPEMDLIQLHPQMGADIVAPINFPWPVTDIILQHHEKLDGSGYPNGIIGDEILLEAKILTVSDVVEAMSSHRPYRPALGLEAALEEIQKQASVLYDADLVNIVVDLFTNQGFEFKNGDRELDPVQD